MANLESRLARRIELEDYKKQQLLYDTFSTDSQLTSLYSALLEDTPREVPMPVDMRLWLRAEDAVAASGTLTSIEDRSSNDEAVSIGVAPTVVYDQLNGYPALRFTGTQYLTMDGIADIFNGDDLPFSVFLLVKFSSLAADTTVFSASRAADNTAYMTALARSTVNTWAVRRSGDDAVLNQHTATSYSLDTSTWSLLSAVFDGTNLTVYVSGRRNTETGAVTAGTMAIDRVSLGCKRGSSNTEFFQGDLAEALVYDYALSEEERYAVETYIKEKYGKPSAGSSEISELERSLNENLSSVASAMLLGGL